MTKKVLIISLIVLLMFILAGLAFYFLNQKQAKTVLPKAEESEQEKIISRQIKELDELRQRANLRPLTEEEKKAQIKELDTFYKQSGLKPLSQAEIKKQLEELDRLRLSQ